MTERPTRSLSGNTARRLALGGAGLAALAALGLSLGGCVASPPAPVAAPAQTPAPAPAPQPQPTAAPTQAVTPAYDNWMDAPQTPGDWSFRLIPTGALAQFGSDPANPLFGLECVKATRQVLLHVPRASGGAMLLRTESMDRTLEPASLPSGPSYVRYLVAARDPLLDAMAFSKGRFAAQVSGGLAYYLPAWPEVTRVVEECRR
ncbi:hypothetical protein [Aurantiacibacter suaedae]|uniref:hypothetical protein n=1 Tax=Aurantiacibacter suaedae TaxID=2545755 RepID=UPI0010F66095|nr:hypothetical protein [Aurantiacibacter suaedae]